MKNFLLFIVTIISANVSFAQLTNDQEIDSLYKKIDFSVPDIPAFKALGIDNSKILTPSSIRDFGASFSPFYNSGNLSFPRNFAIELAPAHLSNSLNTVSNYNSNGFKRWLLNSSISVATNRDSNQTYLSIGLRSSFIHKKHDLKRNYFDSLFNKPANVTRLFNNIKLAIQDSLHRHLENYNGETDTVYVISVLQQIDNVIMQNEALKDEIGDDVDSLEKILGDGKTALKFSAISTHDLINGLENQKNIIAKDLIENFENKYWNAARFDIALAYSAISPDSAVKGAKFYAFDIWATQSFRLNNWGQLLLGVNARIPQSDSSFLYNFAATTRFYAGKNKVKAILELQYQNESTTTVSQNILFSCGAEFKLSSSLWVVAMTGYQGKISGNFNNQIIGNLNLKYGIN